MVVKHKFGLLSALFILFGLMSVQAQSVVHPKAYYDAITYQWTDASGVAHENAITDLATDPYQIVALLKKVYCDPNIPGPAYTAYDKDGNRENPVYYGAIGGGWDIAAEDVTPPYEEGYTILMVSLNNDLEIVNPSADASSYFTAASQLVEYIGKNVASVQLLTDGLRIGSGELAGTTFNVSGTYNRFFILGKGQARKKDDKVLALEQQDGVVRGERVPFKEMFEQFSPSDGNPDNPILDFYAKMVGGEVYPVIHDCSSVIEREHEFSMAGKEGTEAKSLTGLNIFIPDYRLKYFEATSSSHTVDGRTLYPYKDVNGNEYGTVRNLTANFYKYNSDYAPRVGIYVIDLTAAAAAGSEERTFDVTLDWTSSLNEMAGENVPQTYTVYIVMTDEDGNEYNEELVATGETTYTYTVPQNEHSYTITYIVHGKPADGEHDVFVAWSNTADVTIPGWYDFLSLVLDHYESDYLASDENNYYRNFLNIENNDIVNFLTPARVADGENSFMLYRYDAADPNVMTPAAELTLTLSGTRVNYSIAYENQTQLPGYVVPMTTEGTLGNFADDEAIDMSAITFCDQFNAQTSENLHPNRYGYVLISGDKSSTTVEVPVFKTTSGINGYYTLEEVMNDVDGNLPVGVKNANVQLNLSSNPAIYYYTLDRGDNSYPTEEISKLQRRTDGTYLEMLDVLPQYVNTVSEPGIVNRLDKNVITGVAGDFMTYQPVIWTFGNDRVNQDGENSYGSPILRTGIGEVILNAKGTYSASIYGEWLDENGEKCCFYNPTITIEGNVPVGSTTYKPFMYRVWRLCDGVRGYEIDPATGVPHNDPSVERPSKSLIIDEMSDETSLVVGEDGFGPLTFGGLADIPIQFVARFYYVAEGEQEDGAPLYYVVEYTHNWTDKGVGVEELNSDIALSKTYYNAQGISSDKPFDGLNIVITRYSDGSTTAVKVVK